MNLDRRGTGSPPDHPPTLPGAREFAIDRRSAPRDSQDRSLFNSKGSLLLSDGEPRIGPETEGSPIEITGRELSLGGALRRLSEGLPRREANVDELLAEGRSLLAAGELELAFEAFGEVLLARPLDPEPLKDLERIAGAMETQGALADLYARLLQENPNHPSLGTLTRRIGRLRAMVAMAPLPVQAYDAEPEEEPDLVASAEYELEPGAEPDVAALPSEEEAGIRAALATRSSDAASLDLGMKLFGGDGEPAEAIDYELGSLITSGAGGALSMGSGDVGRRGGGGGDDASEPAGSGGGPGFSDRSRVLFLLRRGAAFGVDALLLGLVPLLILAVGTSALSDSAGSFANHLARNATVDGALLRAAILLAALFAFIYCTLCWALGGRTLGGFVAGLRAVDRESGEALSPGRAALRAGAAVIGTAAFLVGPLWALVDPAGEALHDKISRTAVIPG